MPRFVCLTQPTANFVSGKTLRAAPTRQSPQPLVRIGQVAPQSEKGNALQRAGK
jgi:hypothetical protein